MDMVGSMCRHTRRSRNQKCNFDNFEHELRLMPSSCLIPCRTMINKSVLWVENGKLVLILKVSCEVSVETNSSELYLSPVVESLSESGIDTVSFSRGAAGL